MLSRPRINPMHPLYFIAVKSRSSVLIIISHCEAHLTCRGFNLLHNSSAQGRLPAKLSSEKINQIHHISSHYITSYQLIKKTLSSMKQILEKILLIQLIINSIQKKYIYKNQNIGKIKCHQMTHHNLSQLKIS